MKRFAPSALFLPVALFPAIAFSQSASTALYGTIKDSSGAVVAGATVTLSDSGTGQKLTAKTQKTGEYQLLQINPAKYVITVSAPGFADQRKSAELLVNKPATVNFTLSIQGNSETVDVSGTAQTINAQDASLGGSKDNAEIQALPSETRNVGDLLSLQPGVLYLPAAAVDPNFDSRSGSVNGGRSDQGNITLDGVDDNDQVNGYAFTGVLRETQDSVEEFNVTTGNGNADQGRSSGAQISLVTKSGTNHFHGAGYEYFRPTNTVSNDFFNKQAQAQLGYANRPPKLIRNIFGVDVGGPIMKDKLFFFANYEGTRQAESQVVTATTAFPSYIAGNIKYQGDLANGVLDTSTQTLTASNLATLDNYDGCAVCYTPGYQYGPGANPNAQAYFASMPAATLSTVGDGLNTGGFIFPSPHPITQNTTIVRLDYLPSSKHRIFVRGNLQKDTTQGIINLPGQGPSTYLEDNTKGLTAGDTWTISSKMVNDVRYGYIRQGFGSYGVGVGDYVDFRFVSSPTAETRTTIASVPVNNIVDNFNLTVGKHNIQIGGNWRLIHQNRHSNATSFNNASTDPYWLGDGAAPDPTFTNPGAEPVDAGFGNSYLIAYANLVGAVPEVTTQNNYKLTSPTSGTLLADGAFLDRHFKANEYEGYIQDAWNPIHGLTLTLGVRYVNLQTPWETNGQEVSPTIDTNAWFRQREASATMGQIYEPNLTFAPAGPYYGKPGLWKKSKDNFAPRGAIAYSPNNKTSIRAGAGIYYDHFGEGLINIFDQSGAFGLSNSVTNPAATQYLSTAPRFTTRHALPFNNGPVASQISFPYTPLTTSNTDFSISYGVNNKIQTPYNESFDFSLQRELPGGFTLETNYVGRLGRHLLQAVDLAAPVDYVDPAGGGDYYTAGKQLSKLTDSGVKKVAPIAYFENVFPYMKNFDYNGESATQAIYTNEWTPNRATLGETETIADLDFFCYYGCPAGHVPRFWQNQFASLYALSTVGMSYYHALQVTVHHPTSHGLQFDFNYSFSKSIDWGSDAERFGANGGASAILNSWKPSLNKGVSDFDTKHIITVNAVDQLPFGKGKAYLGQVPSYVNAFIGGWQLSGILRMTSGLPFSLFEPGFTTNWDDESYGVVTGKLSAHKQLNEKYEPAYFGNSAQVSAINNGVLSGSPVRLPYPGEAGERNNFRGDGYFSLDSGLTKSWKIESNGNLKFSWEVYNVTNAVRFDPFSINAGLTSGSTLGTASSQLTQPRRMQFALRYDF